MTIVHASRPTLRLIVALSGCLALAGGGPAHAQEDGVFVDPGGPSKKEYALPLESARSQGAGGDSHVTGESGDDVPLFGVGVGDGEETAGARSPGAKKPRSPATREPRSEPSGSEKETGSAPTTPVSQRESGERADDDEPGGVSTATIGTVAASALLLGGALGAMARRRQRLHSP